MHNLEPNDDPVQYSNFSKACIDLCPFCAEKITNDAGGCKFCRSEAAGNSVTAAMRNWHGLETIRSRPAVYIGSTGPLGLHHLAWELIDNALNEAAAGYCKNIALTLNSDGSFNISDDGRGIPIESVQKTGKTFLENQLTSLRSSGQIAQASFTPTHASHKIDLAVVNALCERLEVEIHSKGIIYSQIYCAGKAKGKMQIRGATEQRGTSITLWPDSEIFYDFDANKHLTRIMLDRDILVQRLKELAFLNKGVTISLIDERANNSQTKSEQFYFKNGIRNYVEYLNLGHNILQKPPIYFERRRENIVIECALQWTDSPEKSVHSFANNIATVDGGTHLAGFYKGLIKTVNDYARKQGLIKPEQQDFINESDVSDGLTAVISVKLLKPKFTGRIKEYLDNSEVEQYTEAMVYKAISDWLDYNKAVAKAIVSKIICAQKTERNS